MVKANCMVFAAQVSGAALLRMQGRKCFYCAKPLTLQSATKDHLVPRSSGRDLCLNKVYACQKCNSAKGCRPPTEEEIVRARTLYASLGVPAWEIG